MGYLKNILYLNSIEEYESEALLALQGESAAGAVKECDYLIVTESEEVAAKAMKKGQPVLGVLKTGREKFEAVPYLCEAETLKDEDFDEYLECIYRRYRKLPWDILTTDRLHIRETTEADVEAFYRIYKEPEITLYTENLFENPEEEIAYTKQYREQMYGLYGFGIWTVLEKETGEIVGRAGITLREGFEEPEIGFIIRKDCWGRGYAYEACQAILRYARQVLLFDRVQAFVMPENVASVGLCKKLGFHEKEERMLLGTRYLRFEIIF